MEEDLLIRYIQRWRAYFKRYGIHKGLAILSLQPLIRQVAKEIKDAEELEELRTSGDKDNDENGAIP